MLLRLQAFKDRLLGRKPAAAGLPAPYDTLGEHKLKKVSALELEPNWPVYEEAIDAQLYFINEQLLVTSDPVQIHYLRGFLSGMRKAALLPTEVTQLLTNLNVNRNKSADHTTDADARRLAATYATPAYRKS